MTSVIDYSAAAAALPDEYFLGQVVTFTVHDRDIDRDALEAMINQRNLRTDRLKRRIRPIDAFKKAANDVATHFPRAAEAQHAFLVRPVGQDRQESHRHVVFERAMFRAGQKRRVEHDEVLRLIYNRGHRDEEGNHVGDDVWVEPIWVPGLNLGASEQAWLDSMVGDSGKELIARYRHNCTHLDGHAIRSYVREYVLDLGAISLKSGYGGLYFIRQAHVGELRDLTQLVKDVGSEMHLIPLLDIVDQRDMLAEAFIADTMEEIRQASAAISKILDNQSRTITEATYDEFAGKAAALLQKAADYHGLLDRNLDQATDEITLFKRRTLKLSGRIRLPVSLSQGA